MKSERARRLEMDRNAKLTPAEIAEGWHFCIDWDGMLVNFNDTEGEGAACHCRELPKKPAPPGDKP